MDDLTRPPGEATVTIASPSGRDSSPGSDWGRFAPGTIFAGRFRIVAPLGRGAMGEVYRADDLKLGQDVAPRWTPRGFADERRAWEGPLPNVPDVTARVEAASYRGRPVFFSVLLPWTTPGRMVTPPADVVGRLLIAFTVGIACALLVVTLILTRRHLRTGRGDRRGAFRTATAVFVVVAAGFLLRARFFSSLDIEYQRLGLIFALFFTTP